MPRYLIAALLSRTGDEGAKVAIMLLALAVANPAFGGLGVACLMVPHVVAAPLMGRWVDSSRHPHRILAIATAAFASLLAAATAGTGRLPDAVVLLLLLTAGTFGPAITGGLSSLIRLLTREDRLPRAFGLDSLTYNLAGIIGPALAASIAVIAPREACYLIAGITAAAAIPLLMLRVRRDTDTAPGAESARRPSFLGGLRAILADRPLALATAATSLAQVGFGALVVVIPLRAEAQGSLQWAGWWFAALAGGALLGSVVWSAWPARATVANRVVMGCLAASGLALLGTLAPNPWIVAGFMALAGFANGPQFGALQVVRDRGATEQDRAGVFTLAAGIKVAAAALGTALAGLLASAPLPTLLLTIAILPIVAGTTGLVIGADRPYPPRAA